MALSAAIAACCCCRCCSSLLAAAPQTQTVPTNPNSGLVAAAPPIRTPWIPSPFIACSQAHHQREAAASAAAAAATEGILLYPPADSFHAAAEACIDKRDEAAGRRLHGRIVECGLDCHAFFGTHLIRMFAALRRLPEAQQAFRRIHGRNPHAWRAIISSHSALGRHEEAISLWFDLRGEEEEEEDDDCSSEGINGHVIVAALEACAAAGSSRRRGSLSNGWAIHSHAIEHGLELGGHGSFVANALLHMYAVCGGGMDRAAVMFDRMRIGIGIEATDDIVAWNTMLAGYNRSGEAEQALRIFGTMMRRRMLEQGANVVGSSEPMQAATILPVLKACAMTEDADAGRAAHAYAVEHGLEHEVRIESAIVDMYGKCGRLIDAKAVLLWLCKDDDDDHHRRHMPSIASWNAFLGACVREGEGHAALALLPRMMMMMQDDDHDHDHHREEANGITVACLARACSSVAALGCGRKVHAEALRKGLLGSNPFVCSALVDMYATCGCIDDARLVFDRMPDRMLKRMPDRMPDDMPDRMLNRMSDRTPDDMPDRILPEEEKEGAVMIWTAMVQAYALHGDHAMATECFSRMKQQLRMPEAAATTVAALCILSAYARLGLLQPGCELFRQIRDERGGRVELEHLNAMAGLLGRSGRIEHAEELLECAPFASNAAGWRALLGSCRRWSEVGAASRCFGRLVAMDGGHGASYSIMSSICAETGMRSQAIGIRTAKRCIEGASGGASRMKKPGRAFIEVGTAVHEFGVGDKSQSHPQIAAIRDKLAELNRRIKTEEGHRPRVELVLDPRLASDAEKEEALCGHCERLALAFGLLSSAPGTSVRILKNLRMCPDCHNAVRCISKIEAREIFVKDSYCLHRFDAGHCSCRD